MEFRPKCMAFTMTDAPGQGDVDAACRMMIRYFPECPTPPGPARGGLRGFIAGMPCVWAVSKKKQIVYELSGREDELAQFYDRYMAEDLDYFAIPPESAGGLYKLAEMYKEKQLPELKLIHFAVPGIFSWGLSMMDESGTPALYNDTMRDVMIKLMAVKAKWQQREIKKLFPGIPTLFMIANGGLTVYVSASGVGKWEDAKEIYNEVLAAVDATTAIHCCANFDWPLLMQTNTDIIHFDAHHFCTLQRPFEQKCNLFYFCPFSSILPGVVVGNQLGVGLHKLMNHPQAMGFDSGFGFGHFHNRVRKSGHHLGFGRTP